ncbi:hypothetical protein AK812_SmicGene2012 [Symbiodinium microadriaticum]|uniref:Uncharacterized protein n=1 Tax=Symbiodinium microadriaticum TaxID=2951 RepID=A0A1Q9F2F0_SYMMI|nr:hypothetical protein AK812_SmicGene2012 [Symbiodinium microadriaticum]
MGSIYVGVAIKERGGGFFANSASDTALLNWVAALATSVCGLDGLLIFGKLLMFCNHAMLASTDMESQSSNM